MEELYEETQKIRNKMKFCLKKPELEEQLAEKRFELNNAHLNGQ
jgi:hypothetical protein